MPRVLIVDDDDALRSLLRLRLGDSYEVIDTGNPEQALALVLEHKPDAILLDLMMPKFSGFELCQTLTSLSFTQLVPVFIVSGGAAGRYKAFCHELGAAGYFEKPINFSELKACLDATLKAKRPERRSEPRVRLRVGVKLRGTDTNGKPFEQLNITDNVSPSGFLCGCTAVLQKDTIIDVFLTGEGEHYVGRARVVRAEWHNTPGQRYGFRFVEKRGHWVLQ